MVRARPVPFVADGVRDVELLAAADTFSSSSTSTAQRRAPEISASSPAGASSPRPRSSAQQLSARRGGGRCCKASEFGRRGATPRRRRSARSWGWRTACCSRTIASCSPKASQNAGRKKRISKLATATNSAASAMHAAPSAPHTNPPRHPLGRRAAAPVRRQRSWWWPAAGAHQFPRRAPRRLEPAAALGLSSHPTCRASKRALRLPPLRPMPSGSIERHEADRVGRI